MVVKEYNQLIQKKLIHTEQKRSSTPERRN